MSSRNSDTDSGEAARANTNEDAVSAASLQQLRDHGHEPLCMAPADIFIGPGNAATGAIE